VRHPSELKLGGDLGLVSQSTRLAYILLRNHGTIFYRSTILYHGFDDAEFLHRGEFLMTSMVIALDGPYCLTLTDTIMWYIFCTLLFLLIQCRPHSSAFCCNYWKLSNGIVYTYTGVGKLKLFELIWASLSFFEPKPKNCPFLVSKKLKSIKKLKLKKVNKAQTNSKKLKQAQKSSNKAQKSSN
jgi:hypothetical protein